MSKSEKPDLLDWLGLRFRPDYRRARALGPLITVAVLILIAILVGSTALEFLRAVLGIDEFKDQEAQSAAIRNTGLVLAAMIGVPFVVWRSVIAQKQVEVAEQGQITDRINKAVAGLGSEKTIKRQRTDPNGLLVYELDSDGNVIFSRPIFEETSHPNIEVRVGAIYALERIAQDSDRDHIQIMEILCAYIRGNAPAEVAELDPLHVWDDHVSEVHLSAAADPDSLAYGPVAPEPTIVIVRRWARALKGPRTDVRVGLEVIGRRSKKQIEIERAAKVRGSLVGYRLDLRDTCLQAADLEEMDFEYALFHSARMQGANLQRARVQGAEFKHARMQGTIFRHAEMQNAKFNEAQMQGAFFFKAQMQGATLWRAQLQKAGFGQAQLAGANLNRSRMQGANLSEAELQGAQLRNAKMRSATLIDARLQGANLSEARLEEVILWGAQMDDTTSLSATTFQGAMLRRSNYEKVPLTQIHLDEMFGDGSVMLPTELSRPSHWPSAILDSHDFESHWRAWRKKIDSDPPKDTP